MSKRVLITGSAGFAGAHIVDHLLINTDWDIVGLDSFKHRGDSLRIYQPTDRYKIFCHDLTSPISDRLINKIGHVDYILNVASESHVDRSITDPVPFVDNNCKLIVNILEYARTVSPILFMQMSTDEVYGPALDGTCHREWSPILPSNPYSASKAAQEAIAISYWRTYDVPLILTNCFAMDMRLMMEDGLKSYNEINVGDMVWTLGDDENLILTEVTEKIKMPSSGKMIHIKSAKVDQLVTPNHRMMVRKTHGKPRRYGDIEEVLAEDLIGMKSRVRIPLTGEWEGEDIPKEFMVDGVSAETMASVLGWYVSEGYTTDKNGVCFGAGSEEQQGNLLKLLAVFGNSYVNGRSVRVHNSRLRSIVENFEKYAENKIIPKDIKNMRKDLLEIFLSSAIAGDGTTYSSKFTEWYVYYTKSLKLTEDIAEVAMKVGYGVNICERETWNPSHTILGKSYMVRIRTAHTDIESANVHEVGYSGDVWCVKTSTGRVFVERNGIISLSGQTMNLFGERQDKEKFIPSTISKIERGEMVTIHGNEDYIGKRFYLHARNQADAMLFLIKRGHITHYVDTLDHVTFPDRYNIVGDTEKDNLEMAQLIAHKMNKELNYKLVDFHAARPGHDRRYALDGDKMKQLGWVAPISFDDSLMRTIEWTLARGREWM